MLHFNCAMTQLLSKFDKTLKVELVRKLIVVLSLFLVTTTISFAQFKRQREYSGFFDTYYYRGPITFTFGAGMTTYRGDLTDGLGLKGLSYGLSLGANYKIWPHIVLGAEFSYLNLQSTDFNQSRNASFVASGYELQAYGRLYLIDEIVRIAKDRKKESQYTFCKPYIHLGVGLMLFHSTTTASNPLVINPNIANPITLALPAGMGLQFTITQRSSLCLEYVYRFTTTDNIDNITNVGSANDGYGLLQAKFQFTPTAPKRRKKLSLPPPSQYDGPKGTETWKTKKQQEQQNRPQREEYEIPESTDQEKTDEEINETPQEEVIEEEVAPE